MIKKFWNWGWGIYHKNEELWNYLIAGGLATFINVGVKWLLLFTILDPDNAFQLQVAVIISWIVAFIFAYICNRIFVFKSKNKKLKEFIKFFISRITTLLMEMFLMWFFITLLGLDSNVWVIIWTLVVQVLVIIFNYIFSKIFVFKEK